MYLIQNGNTTITSYFTDQCTNVTKLKFVVTIFINIIQFTSHFRSIIDYVHL